MLHVTNGDVAAYLIRSAGIQGDVLPWQDVLHIGPVPGSMSMNALSRRRASFLASRGWGDEENLFESFLQRSASLQSNAAKGQVTLWFEHDLYDQLQLIQILAWLSEIGTRPHEYFLICIDQYPGVETFHGLGDLNREQITHLFDTRKLVTSSQFSDASDAWESFTSSNPVRHQEMADRVVPDLPFLQDAYQRFLQEWPSSHNGLSRTEAHALGLVANGMHDPAGLFRDHWASEKAPFMGDWTFWDTILSLSRGSFPLVTIEGPQEMENFRDAQIYITQEGTAVLHGDKDAIHLRGIDRWYGGYHATEASKVFRWDVTQGRLIGPDTSLNFPSEDNL